MLLVSGDVSYSKGLKNSCGLQCELEPGIQLFWRTKLGTS